MKAFHIREDDEAEIKSWMEEVKADRLKAGVDNGVGAIGGETTYSFTPTGVGMFLEVTYFGVKKDFSHVEDW